jgi:hypothetical protein
MRRLPLFYTFNTGEFQDLSSGVTLSDPSLFQGTGHNPGPDQQPVFFIRSISSVSRPYQEKNRSASRDLQR